MTPFTHTFHSVHFVTFDFRIYSTTLLRCHLQVQLFTGRKDLKNTLMFPASRGGKPLSGGQIFVPQQQDRAEKCSSSPHVQRDNFENIGRESNSYILKIKEIFVMILWFIFLSDFITPDYLVEKSRGKLPPKFVNFLNLYFTPLVVHASDMEIGNGNRRGQRLSFFQQPMMPYINVFIVLEEDDIL